MDGNKLYLFKFRDINNKHGIKIKKSLVLFGPRQQTAHNKCFNNLSNNETISETCDSRAWLATVACVRSIPSIDTERDFYSRKTLYHRLNGQNQIPLKNI
ncbi:hypothetical protein B5X24_HaOG207682 [Helicoverpa armigera]|uniref:Uncharacterized protein n=1 Tax=Helicoverpa armigera TaxID=29058 RepID=A0A2W1BI63_HELAM|nr:hypothetical protein B5X24_HaOG207682 [Helicoverpa armigera]